MNKKAIKKVIEKTWPYGNVNIAKFKKYKIGKIVLYKVFIKDLEEKTGYLAYYLLGTKIIALDSNIFKKFVAKERRFIIAHELYHYRQFLTLKSQYGYKRALKMFHSDILKKEIEAYKDTLIRFLDYNIVTNQKIISIFFSKIFVPIYNVSIEYKEFDKIWKSTLCRHER